MNMNFVSQRLLFQFFTFARIFTLFSLSLKFPRMALPAAEVIEEEPLYVNAKQYHRILKRRQARAKLEAENRLAKSRKVGFIYKLELPCPATFCS